MRKIGIVAALLLVAAGVLSARTGAVPELDRQALQSGLHPVALAAASSTGAPAVESRSRELWVASQGTNTVFILQFPQMEVLARIVLPTGAEPHLTTFHSSRYAYVSGMGDGTYYVIDAETRQIVKALKAGPGGAHQARVSPDGSTALLTMVGNRTLVRLAVDEIRGAWTTTGSLSLAELQRSPVCTVFRSDGRQAFVSLLPSGIAIVDVPSMTLQGMLSTDGFVACGMIRSADGSHAVIASSGGGGHIYALNLSNGTLADHGTVGAADWHSFNMTPDERLGVGTSPASDEIVLIDLTARPVRKLGTLALTALPGPSANQPDALGGGEAIQDGMLPVSLRAAGQVAVVDLKNMSGRTYTQVVPPRSGFHLLTCMGCAVHGVTVRPAGRQ